MSAAAAACVPVVRTEGLNPLVTTGAGNPLDVRDTLISEAAPDIAHSHRQHQVVSGHIDGISAHSGSF